MTDISAIVLEARQFDDRWQVSEAGQLRGSGKSAAEALRQALASHAGNQRLQLNWMSPPDDSIPLYLHSGQLTADKFKVAITAYEAEHEETQTTSPPLDPGNTEHTEGRGEDADADADQEEDQEEADEPDQAPHSTQRKKPVT